MANLLQHSESSNLFINAKPRDVSLVELLHNRLFSANKSNELLALFKQ